MIAVDNVELTWSNPKTPNEVFFAKGVENLLKTKKRLFFERVYSKVDMGILVTRPSRTFSCVAYRQNPDTKKQEKWVWTEPELLLADKKLYKPKKIATGLDIDINVPTDPEQAFFFYEIFRQGLGYVGYRLRDWDKEAQVQNEKEGKESLVRYIVLDKMDEADVNLRCKALGVSIDDKGLARKKRDLIDRVLILDQAETYSLEKFIEESKAITEELKYKAYVNEALAAKVITMDADVLKYAGTKQAIVRVPVQQLANPTQFIVDHLLSNKEAKEIFDIAVTGVVEEVAKVAVDWEKVTNIQAIKKIAREYFKFTYEEIPADASVEDVKNMIREKLVY